MKTNAFLVFNVNVSYNMSINTWFIILLRRGLRQRKTRQGFSVGFFWAGFPFLVFLIFLVS